MNTSQNSSPKPDTKFQASSASNWISFFALFGSFGTLICCALPASLVAMGAGATLISLVGNFPQLVWLSENKEWTFALSGLFIGVGYLNMWLTRNAPCPMDPQLARACRVGKRVSKWVLALSALLFVVGGLFAYVFPLFME